MQQAAWSELPMTLRVVVIALAAVQLAVEVAALVVLVRTPVERVRFGVKWPWVLIILFVNLVGAVIFLTLGRVPAEVGDASQEGTRVEDMKRAAELLYGADEDGGSDR